MAKVASDTHRIQLEFGATAYDRLNALKAKTEATSYAEVIKNALRLYEGMIEEVENGKSFYAMDKDGIMTNFEMFV